ETGYQVEGIWYPRAGTLGGCTAHNAMITITPQDSDWNAIAAFTRDDSWRAEHMHKYYARLENCTYRPRPGPRYAIEGFLWSMRALLTGRTGAGDWGHGHGFSGWLSTSAAATRVILADTASTSLLLR